MAVAVHATQVQAFYDEHIVYKVADFVDGNRRVDAAWNTIQQWAPAGPRRILEIGCGLGAMAWRMAARWPDAQVVGVDISPRSIEYASKLFVLPNLTFASGRIEELELGRDYDLIVLVDVFEHIADADKPAFNASLEPLLSANGRVVLTFPTPAYQRILRSTAPDKLQPVDEEIELATLQALATATATNLLMYREHSVWISGDYGHAVLGRREAGRPVERPEPAPPPTTIERAVRKVRSLFQAEDPASREARLRLIERVLGSGAYRPR
jgi:2-polyprenyl-3-methyl-5-hydroxy-6-metoxy-1,4-benzoquinol methylase